jgi:orotidine-5'-phosphate decarboxylase
VTNPAANQRLIVALDFPSAADALRLADSLSGICTWFKVGLELFIAAGPTVVTDLKKRGFSVFLDLKLHDIPNTVAGAVRSAAATGADMLTVHASGGPAMLAAAVEAASAIAHPLELLAVTVLTSMDSEQLDAIGIAAEPADQVARLARLAADSGLRGIVCSPNEVTKLRHIFGDTVLLVTPGIRPAGADVQDQKRIATPAKAIEDGASYLVVGRPITQAPDPRAAAATIQREIAEALALQT